MGLDEYVIGEVKRISPEAPVLIVEVNQEDKRLGLASNVAANVSQFRCRTTPCCRSRWSATTPLKFSENNLRQIAAPNEYLIVD